MRKAAKHRGKRNKMQRPQAASARAPVAARKATWNPIADTKSSLATIAERDAISKEYAVHL